MSGELVAADCVGAVDAEDGGPVVGEEEAGEGACGWSMEVLTCWRWKTHLVLGRLARLP